MERCDEKASSCSGALMDQPSLKRQRSLSRGSTRHYKRRVSYKMSFLHIHAHTAFFEEPIFCPSSTTSVIDGYPYQNTNTLPFLLGENEDAEVSLECEEKEDDDTHAVATSGYGVADLARSVMYEGNAQTPGTFGSPEISRELIQDSHGLGARADSSSVQSPIVITIVDDNALAVDDPRRSYDVEDFMRTWQRRPPSGERVPPFEHRLKVHARIAYVSRDQIENEDLDIQGLWWHSMGFDRKDVLEARTLLNSSHRSIAPKPTSKSAQSHSTSPHSREGRQFRFRAFNPSHRTHCSHFQLRNVLAASSRAHIFYSTGNKVMRTSLACPDISNSIMDLSKPTNSTDGFRITCLSTTQKSPSTGYQSDSVLLAGGFYGEYAMLDLSPSTTNNPIEGQVAPGYNGLINYVETWSARRSGLLQATFCSNDSLLRVMDIRTLRHTSCFSYEHAINCSAISPDGRLRLLAGDTCDSMITDAERGNVIATLKGHRDYAFACAWSENSRHFATSAQDGQVILWDARRWTKPLQTFPSVMSCTRSLRFTNNGAALVAAEDYDVVNVYDMTDFNHHQEIRFFGSIAGVALLDGGSEMIVANADRTVGGLLSFERVPQYIHGDSLDDSFDTGSGKDGLNHRHMIGRERNGLQHSSSLTDVFV